MMVGGPNNTTRQTFIYDSNTKEVTRCAVYMGDMDRCLTNAYYRVPSNPSIIILFGSTLLHIFDSDTHTFKAMQYVSESSIEQMQEGQSLKEKVEPLKKPVTTNIGDLI